MLVMLVTYLVFIKIVLKRNHMKNQMILLIMMMMIMLFMEMEKISMSSLMSNWRCKIYNTQK